MKIYSLTEEQVSYLQAQLDVAQEALYDEMREATKKRDRQRAVKEREYLAEIEGQLDVPLDEPQVLRQAAAIMRRYDQTGARRVMDLAIKLEKTGG